MRLFQRRADNGVSHGEALGAYLKFMEGTGPRSFTFPKGDFSADQISRDVEGIILHETRHMADKSWADRLYEFQRKRGQPWPRALCARCGEQLANTSPPVAT